MTTEGMICSGDQAFATALNRRTNDVVPEWQVFRGAIVHSAGDTPMLRIKDALLGIHSGKVVFLESDVSMLHELMTKHGFKLEDVFALTDGQFMMPGLIDTHIHAPQYANAGLGSATPLLEWLMDYTFPTEYRFSDLEWAALVYSSVVRRTIANGTTTASYYATVHAEAALLLCDIIECKGQRALVGKVNADNYPKEFHTENTQQSLEQTETFFRNVIARKNPLVMPVLTPRFARSCSEELMTSLGQMARQFNFHVQTHLGETKNECQNIEDSFPDCRTYTDIYEKCGLLTSKTILAHGVYLNDEDLRRLKSRDVGIAHCPNANATLISGLCDVKRLSANGIKVGLGTDISGGYSPSILDAMRRAIDVSAHLSHTKPSDYKVMTYEDVFYLATRGGSQVLGLEDKVGNFEVGKEFDALLIDVNVENGPIDAMPDDGLKEHVQRFIFLGDDRNIIKVFVAGRQIKPS